MKNYIAGFEDTTLILDRNERSGSWGARQAQAKAPAISGADDLDIPDSLIREAGLCLIDLRLTERYENEPDYFNGLVIGTPREGAAAEPLDR